MGFLSSPLFGLSIAGAGAGMSAAAALNSGRATQLANEYNAAELRQQAELSRIKAAKYREMGEIEANDVLREYETLKGEQRTAYAASGVMVGAGSAAETQANTAAEGVYSSGKTRYARALQAWESDVEAVNLEGRASFTLANSGNHNISAIASGLTGLSNAYAQFGQW